MLKIKTHEIATFSPNECVDIAISCVLVRTHSDLNVLVSHLCPAKDTEKNIFDFFGETIECVANVSRMCRVCVQAKDWPKSETRDTGLRANVKLMHVLMWKSS